MASDTIPHRAPYMDRVNRGTWRRRGPLRQFGTASGWLEAGEQVAIEYVAHFVRDTPILDIGVGGGRTAPLLAALSADYRGIDYLAEMVALARRRFPAFRFLEMDARRLSFPDQSFRLVTFSYNGIDSVETLPVAWRSCRKFIVCCFLVGIRILRTQPRWPGA